MSDSGFEIEGWEEFVEAYSKLIDKWEAKKIVLLKEIGNTLEANIKPLIPADNSNLVDEFTVTVSGSESVSYSTNVEYALYVNDGHVQHKRFLPLRCLSAGGRSKYVHGKNSKGIMLKERYVSGKHFIEDGMVTAQPQIESLINSFMDQIKREALGSQM